MNKVIKLWNIVRRNIYTIIIFLLVILAVKIIVIGFSLDSQGFAGNLLAEFVGLVFGVLATLFIVDRYYNSLEKQKWAKVRQITYTALAHDLGKLFASAVYSFETEYGDDELLLVNQVLKPGEGTLDSIQAIVSRVEEIERQVLVADDRERENNANEFYNSLIKFESLIEPSVDHIRNILIPRMLLHSDDQILIDLLVSFDQLTYFGRDLVEQITEMTTKGISIESIHRNYGAWTNKLLSAALNIYKELWKVWKSK